MSSRFNSLGDYCNPESGNAVLMIKQQCQQQQCQQQQCQQQQCPQQQ
jgi:hypothetical protein